MASICSRIVGVSLDEFTGLVLRLFDFVLHVGTCQPAKEFMASLVEGITSTRMQIALEQTDGCNLLFHRNASVLFLKVTFPTSPF